MTGHPLLVPGWRSQRLPPACPAITCLLLTLSTVITRDTQLLPRRASVCAATAAWPAWHEPLQGLPAGRDRQGSSAVLGAPNPPSLNNSVEAIFSKILGADDGQRSALNKWTPSCNLVAAVRSIFTGMQAMSKVAHAGWTLEEGFHQTLVCAWQGVAARHEGRCGRAAFKGARSRGGRVGKGGDSKEAGSKENGIMRGVRALNGMQRLEMRGQAAWKTALAACASTARHACLRIGKLRTPVA